VDILIVYGYHSRETLALRTGEHFKEHNSNPRIEVMKYEGEKDSKKSTYHLRKFVEKFNPEISPIILHEDSAFSHLYGAIVYCAKSRKERRRGARELRKFVAKNNLVVFGTFLTPSVNYNLFDIELNSFLSVEKANNLIDTFAGYLIDLHSKKQIKL